MKENEQALGHVADMLNALACIDRFIENMLSLIHISEPTRPY